MCRSIKPLFNFDPPATDEEMREASRQFVRKISGMNKPSKVNEEIFNKAVDKVTDDARSLLGSLITNAESRNRQVEAQRAHERAIKRLGIAR